MTVATAKPTFDQQSFEAFLHARSEPVWLVEQRREAWQTFQAKDWPSRSDEEWIRTDIRLFKLNQFALPQSRDQWSRGGSAGASPSQDAASPSPITPLLTA